MSLSEHQINQLIAAGTVPIPPNFPAIASLKPTHDDKDHRIISNVICLEHRVSPVQVNRYFVPIDAVRATFRLEKQWSKRRKGVWRFGTQAQDSLRRLLGINPPQQQTAAEAAPQPDESKVVDQSSEPPPDQPQPDEQKGTGQPPPDHPAGEKTGQNPGHTDHSDTFRYGVVFVREHTGVLMQTDKAMTAGEVAAIPVGCEDCPMEKDDDKDEE